MRYVESRRRIMRYRHVAESRRCAAAALLSTVTLDPTPLPDSTVQRRPASPGYISPAGSGARYDYMTIDLLTQLCICVFPVSSVDYVLRRYLIVVLTHAVRRAAFTSAQLHVCGHERCMDRSHDRRRTTEFETEKGARDGVFAIRSHSIHFVIACFSQCFASKKFTWLLWGIDLEPTRKPISHWQHCCSAFLNMMNLSVSGATITPNALSTLTSVLVSVTTANGANASWPHSLSVSHLPPSNYEQPTRYPDDVLSDLLLSS
jgi:hypothetical protein